MKKLIIFLFPFIAFTQVDNVKLQQDFIKDLNTYRTSKGLSSVRLDAECIQTAKKQAEYCAENNILTHNRADQDLITFLETGFKENGYWTTGLVDSQRCMQSWITSPDHNKNLLAPYAIKIGIYSVTSKSGEKYTFLVLKTS